MSELSGEAIIVHGCKLTPEGGLSDRAMMRVDRAVELWEQGVAPEIVLTGDHTFTLMHEPVRTEASAMFDHALSRGVPQDILHTEEKSLDTVGNVVLTKKDHILPNNWHELVVVTSETHMPRTLDIYSHVLGPGYAVQAAASPEQKAPDSRSLRLWEQIGTLMVDEVLEDTAIGDHEAIQERLFNLVPGYDRPNNILGKSRFAARIGMRQTRLWMQSAAGALSRGSASS